jgi:hypothetical protein
MLNESLSSIFSYVHQSFIRSVLMTCALHVITELVRHIYCSVSSLLSYHLYHSPDGNLANTFLVLRKNIPLDPTATFVLLFRNMRIWAMKLKLHRMYFNTHLSILQFSDYLERVILHNFWKVCVCKRRNHYQTIVCYIISRRSMGSFASSGLVQKDMDESIEFFATVLV